MPPSTDTAPAAEFAGLARVQSLARWVRVLSLIGIVLLVSLPPVLWSDPQWLAQVASRQLGIGLDTPLQMSSSARLFGLFSSWLPAGVAAYALYQLWCLFGCYARAEVFTLEPVLRLRRLGAALVLMSAARPIGGTLTVLALTLSNPPGQRVLSFELAWQDYLALLFGLMLLAMAMVMREAVRVTQEHAEFV